MSSLKQDIPYTNFGFDNFFQLTANLNRVKAIFI